jgi:hypothetical protein
MRFTEYELPLTVTGATENVMARQKHRKRVVDIDLTLHGPNERFMLRDAVSSQILPALAVFPDVEVALGTQPSYSTQQVEKTVARLVGDDLGRLRRRVTVKARSVLVHSARTYSAQTRSEPVWYHPENPEAVGAQLRSWE